MSVGAHNRSNDGSQKIGQDKNPYDGPGQVHVVSYKKDGPGLNALNQEGAEQNGHAGTAGDAQRQRGQHGAPPSLPLWRSQGR